MTIIKESGMAFGDYDDKNLFKIENSSIHTLAGLNIKSVEFIFSNFPHHQHCSYETSKRISGK